MSSTPRYSLDLMSVSQTGKYITFNDLAVALDALVQPVVVDSTSTAPGGGEAEGTLYYTSTSCTGAWTGHDNELAQLYNGSWRFYALPSKFVYYDLNAAAEVRIP